MFPTPKRPLKWTKAKPMPSKRKNAHAVALGRKGGQSRARKLSKARRIEIATIGSLAAKLKKALDAKDKVL